MWGRRGHPLKRQQPQGSSPDTKSARPFGVPRTVSNQSVFFGNHPLLSILLQLQEQTDLICFKWGWSRLTGWSNSIPNFFLIIIRLAVLSRAKVSLKWTILSSTEVMFNPCSNSRQWTIANITHQLLETPLHGQCLMPSAPSSTSFVKPFSIPLLQMQTGTTALCYDHENNGQIL